MLRAHRLRFLLFVSLTGCVRGVAMDDANATESSTGADAPTNETDDSTAADTSSTSDETESGDGDGDGDVCESGCEDSTEIAEGIVFCEDGRTNRIGGGTFDPTISAPGCGGNEDMIECTSDAQCEAGGQCIHGSTTDPFGSDTTWCRCAYSCASDRDCAEGSVCVPPDVLVGTPDWPICLTAECETNADCGECGECGLGVATLGCERVYAIQCRTTEDHCSSGFDCELGNCFPDQDGLWSCTYERC